MNSEAWRQTGAYRRIGCSRQLPLIAAIRNAGYDVATVVLLGTTAENACQVTVRPGYTAAMRET